MPIEADASLAKTTRQFDLFGNAISKFDHIGCGGLLDHIPTKTITRLQVKFGSSPEDFILMFWVKPK